MYIYIYMYVYTCVHPSGIPRAHWRYMYIHSWGVLFLFECYHMLCDMDSLNELGALARNFGRWFKIHEKQDYFFCIIRPEDKTAAKSILSCVLYYHRYPNIKSRSSIISYFNSSRLELKSLADTTSNRPLDITITSISFYHQRKFAPNPMTWLQQKP